MKLLLDSTFEGHHVRILGLVDTAQFTVIIDGRVYSGFTSRVAALAAARSMVHSS